MSNIKKMTWKELEAYLETHHEANGVIVFKQHPSWRKQYSELARSYRVDGKGNHFYSGKISNSIYGFCLDKNERDSEGIRLDWVLYAPADERWDVDYCYLLNE